MRIDELVGVEVGICQSGGLSALAVGVWLHERGITARHFIADLGQAPSVELAALADSLRRHGIWATVVDLREAMAATTLDLLRYRARHDGGYWNTAGASRMVLVRELAPRMIEVGCEALAHGCVGGGNDQRRFERYVRALAPALRCYSPWVDPAALAQFPNRATMESSVRAFALALDRGSSATSSADVNLAGASHESAALEDLRTPVTVISPRWSIWPSAAPDKPETVTVRFERGNVVDVSGSGAHPLAALTAAHGLGARHGVWLRDVVEGRIIGTRCRGVYEAPALEVLDRAWRRVLEVSLDRPSRALYDRLSAALGQAMYEARYLEPDSAAARLAIDGLLAGASATVSLSLYRGTATVIGIEVPGGPRGQQTRFSNGGHRWRDPVEPPLAASSATVSAARTADR